MPRKMFLPNTLVICCPDTRPGSPDYDGIPDYIRKKVLHPNEEAVFLQIFGGAICLAHEEMAELQAGLIAQIEFWAKSREDLAVIATIHKSCAFYSEVGMTGEEKDCRNDLVVSRHALQWYLRKLKKVNCLYISEEGEKLGHAWV